MCVREEGEREREREREIHHNVCLLFDHRQRLVVLLLRRSRNVRTVCMLRSSTMERECRCTSRGIGLSTSAEASSQCNLIRYSIHVQAMSHAQYLKAQIIIIFIVKTDLTLYTSDVRAHDVCLFAVLR